MYYLHRLVVTPRVQKYKFRVLSLNKEGRLSELMDGLSESSRGSGRVLSDQLSKSAAGLGELVLKGENPNPGIEPYIKHIITHLQPL